MSLSALFFPPPLAANATTLTGAGLTSDGQGTDSVLLEHHASWRRFQPLSEGRRGFINNGDGAGTPISIEPLPGSYTFNILRTQGR